MDIQGRLPDRPRDGLLIVETSIFTRRAASLLDDESYRLLQVELVRNPEAGVLIRGSGGLRKIRWADRGSGKRGGLRIIYHWYGSHALLLMLLVYRKSDQEDLTREQLRVLKAVVEEEFR